MSDLILKYGAACDWKTDVKYKTELGVNKLMDPKKSKVIQ